MYKTFHNSTAKEIIAQLEWVERMEPWFRKRFNSQNMWQALILMLCITYYHQNQTKYEDNMQMAT